MDTPDSLWAEQREAFPLARRVDLADLLDGVERSCAVDSTELLARWVGVYDEGLRFLVALYAAADDGLQELTDKSTASAALLAIGRAAALARAARILVLQGLEEVARPTARTLVETLDLLTVLVADPAFAEAFGPDDPDHDESEFWKAHIGYGRIGNRLAAIWRSIGATPEQVAAMNDERATLGRVLSVSVHGSISATFRSSFVPSLRYPGQLSRSFLGHVSLHSPALLVRLARSIHATGVTLLKLQQIENGAPLLEAIPDGENLHTMYAAHFALEAVLDRLTADLPDSSAYFGPNAMDE